jgi:signal transduction histidine kinase
LVDDLLVYARKGSLSLERTQVDVSVLVREIGDEFRVSAQAESVTLIDQSMPGLWVDGDRHALRQALANLLANAIRYADSGSTVRVRAGREEPWVWMSVEDEGPGIAVEDQDRVFQRFWRGDPREGREEGRSGLGLTIVRQIAEAHGGEVKLASEVGRGAAFAIWLPAVEPTMPGAATTPPDDSAGA